MPRTTIDNRARKRRINRQAFNRLRRQMEALNNMSEADFATLQKDLKKLEAAMEKGESLKTTDLPNWRELRTLGVIREKDGDLLLTAVGSDVLAEEE